MEFTTLHFVLIVSRLKANISFEFFKKEKEKRRRRKKNNCFYSEGKGQKKLGKKKEKENRLLLLLLFRWYWAPTRKRSKKRTTAGDEHLATGVASARTCAMSFSVSSSLAFFFSTAYFVIFCKKNHTCRFLSVI